MAVVGVADFNGEEALEKIIWDIYVYLQSLSVRRFNRFLGRSSAERASASWTEINIQLSRFVKDPKNHYSGIMTTIDREKRKFRSHPGYVHRLAKLEDFLKQAPKFSKDYNCLVRVPDSFNKRRHRSKMEPLD